MDVIALHQAGFTNAVAALGTSFTADHARLVARYAKEAILIFDADGAGQKGTQRAIGLLRETGVDIRVVSIPDGKDPDEFIKKNGAYYTFDEAMCKAFGFPAKSMYKDPLDDIIASHVKELVTFLKEMGCYSVVAADRTTREEMTEEDVEAEKTKETEEEE